MLSEVKPVAAVGTDPDRPEGVPEYCHEKIRQMIDYWKSIHPPSGLPGRQHFDPLDIPHLLSNIRLQDVVGDPPRIRMRLMGTRIREFFGRELTGKWFDEVFEDFENSETYRNYLDVIRNKRPCWRRGRAGLVYEKEFLTLERVHLPLAQDGTTVDMILTCMVFVDKDGSYV